MLESLAGLEGITSLNWESQVSQNPHLRSISGLLGLVDVKTELDLQGCPTVSLQNGTELESEMCCLSVTFSSGNCTGCNGAMCKNGRIVCPAGQEAVDRKSVV